MLDLSKIYEYARSVLDSNQQSGIYAGKQKDLEKQIKTESTEYKRRSNEISKIFAPKKHGVVWAAIAFVIVFICTIVIFQITQNSNPNNQSVDSSSSSATSTTASSESFESNDSIEADSSVTESETTENITMPCYVTEEPFSAETESTETDIVEDTVESYNGYKLGDMVYYSGTVHYVASDTNQLSGACHGGIAMISRINPDGIHKFHLVSAEEQCTVYGWVDEVFIKPIE